MIPTGTIVYGVVTDNGGGTPRKASLIDYGVDIQLPGRAGVWNYPHRITPCGDRPPDDIDSIPRRVGYPFLAVIGIDDSITCYFEEVAAYAECPENSGSSAFMPPTTGGGGQGGTVPGGGGGPSPPSGGIGGGGTPGGVA